MPNRPRPSSASTLGSGTVPGVDRIDRNVDDWQARPSRRRSWAALLCVDEIAGLRRYRCRGHVRYEAEVLPPPGELTPGSAVTEQQLNTMPVLWLQVESENRPRGRPEIRPMEPTKSLGLTSPASRNRAVAVRVDAALVCGGCTAGQVVGPDPGPPRGRCAMLMRGSPECGNGGADVDPLVAGIHEEQVLDDRRCRASGGHI